MMQSSPTPPPTLICDASRPLISIGSLREEVILYNLSKERANYLYRDYGHLIGREVTEKTLTHELSGGQKVLLMAMLALYSPARSIRFYDLHTSLDQTNRDIISGIIERFAVEKDILLDSRK